MEYCMVEGDVLIARSQQIVGIEIPAGLQDVEIRRLRYDSAVILDIKDVNVFYIDNNGFKHIDQKYGELVDCKWDDKLIKGDDGLWRIEGQADHLSPLIKGECGRRIEAVVSANTRENLNAEIGRLQYQKPAGWEQRTDKIMDVLSWIRAMMTANRDMIIALDDSYAEDSKWPIFPAGSQAIIDEL